MLLKEPLIHVVVLFLNLILAKYQNNKKIHMICRDNLHIIDYFAKRAACFNCCFINIKALNFITHIYCILIIAIIGIFIICSLRVFS